MKARLSIMVDAIASLSYLLLAMICLPFWFIGSVLVGRDIYDWWDRRKRRSK